MNTDGYDWVAPPRSYKVFVCVAPSGLKGFLCGHTQRFAHCVRSHWAIVVSRSALFKEFLFCAPGGACIANVLRLQFATARHFRVALPSELNFEMVAEPKAARPSAFAKATAGQAGRLHWAKIVAPSGRWRFRLRTACYGGTSRAFAPLCYGVTWRGSLQAMVIPRSGGAVFVAPTRGKFSDIQCNPYKAGRHLC